MCPSGNGPAHGHVSGPENFGKLLSFPEHVGEFSWVLWVLDFNPEEGCLWEGGREGPAH